MYKTIIFILLSILSFTINDQLMSFRTNDTCKILKLKNIGYPLDYVNISRHELPIVSDEVADKFVAMRIYGSDITIARLDQLQLFNYMFEKLSLKSNISCGFSITVMYRDSFHVEEKLSPKLIRAHVTMNILHAKLESQGVSPPGITSFDTDDEIWKSFSDVKLNNYYQKHVPHVIWPFQSPWQTITGGSKSSRKKQRKHSETSDDLSIELDHTVMTHFKYIASMCVMAFFIIAVLLKRATEILANERMINDLESGYSLKRQCFGKEKDVRQMNKMSCIQESQTQNISISNHTPNNANNVKCETPDKKTFTNQKTPHKHQIEQEIISVNPLVLNDGISVDIKEMIAVVVNDIKDSTKVSDTSFAKQIPELLTQPSVLTAAKGLSKTEKCYVEHNLSGCNTNDTNILQTNTGSYSKVKAASSTEDVSKTIPSVQLSKEEKLKSSSEKEKISSLESKKENCRTIGYNWVHRVLLRKRKRRSSKNDPMLTESEKQNIKNDFLYANPLLSEETDFMVCLKGDKSILVLSDDVTVAKKGTNKNRNQTKNISRFDNTKNSYISVNQLSNKPNINSAQANCNIYCYDNNSLYNANYYQQQNVELGQHAFYSHQNNQFDHNASPNYNNNFYHTNPTMSYNQSYYNASPYYYNQYYYNIPPYYNNLYYNTPSYYDHFYYNTPPYYNHLYYNTPPNYYNHFIPTYQY